MHHTYSIAMEKSVPWLQQTTSISMECPFRIKINADVLSRNGVDIPATPIFKVIGTDGYTLESSPLLVSVVDSSVAHHVGG